MIDLAVRMLSCKHSGSELYHSVRINGNAGNIVFCCATDWVPPEFVLFTGRPVEVSVARHFSDELQMGLSFS